MGWFDIIKETVTTTSSGTAPLFNNTTVSTVLSGKKRKKKKKDDKKKNKGADIKTGNLSASTVKKITKIAKDRGYTVGSMKKE